MVKQVRMERQQKLDELDSAANAVNLILEKANIPHLFIGGYAVGLVGGLEARMTEDVDVLVEKECEDVVLKDRRFSRCADGRIAFKSHSKSDPTMVDVMCHDKYVGGFQLPAPTKTVCKHEIDPDKLHDRPNITSSIYILRPEYLLMTKVMPWYCAFVATRQSERMRINDDFADIKILLEWISRKKSRLQVDNCPPAHRSKLFRALGTLFVDQRSIRYALMDALGSHNLRLILDEVEA